MRIMVSRRLPLRSDASAAICSAWASTSCRRTGSPSAPAPPRPRASAIPTWTRSGPPLEGVEIRIAPDSGRRPGPRVRGRRGPDSRPHRHGRATTTAPTSTPWRSPAAGFTPATSATSTAEAGSSSPGRKKEIIVLASGKNIYPEEIEAHYAQSPFIRELCVLGVALPGEPSAERLHAVVVPDLEVMRERRIVNFREIIRFDIESLSLGLPHHKRVLSFDVWMEELPRTTTRKLKRHEIERRYRETQARAARAGRAGRVERRGRSLGGRTRTRAGILAAIRGRRAARRGRPPGLEPRTRPRPRLDGAGGIAVAAWSTTSAWTCPMTSPRASSPSGTSSMPSRPGVGRPAPPTQAQVDPWARVLTADESRSGAGRASCGPSPLFSSVGVRLVRTLNLRRATAPRASRGGPRAPAAERARSSSARTTRATSTRSCWSGRCPTGRSGACSSSARASTSRRRSCAGSPS